MKPKTYVLTAAIALMVLAFGAYMGGFFGGRAAASVALQVNPVVSLSLSERNTVVGAEGLDEQGKALMTSLNLNGKDLSEALRMIAGKLREAGLLADGRRLFVAISPVGNRLRDEARQTLAETIEEKLREILTEYGVNADVVSVAMSTELAKALHELGLYPADYVDLVDAVGSEAAMKILNLQKELGIDPTLFKEELSTITAAVIDMIEAGIPTENALTILRSSLAFDPTLEELTTITAAMIDLHEAGASQENIMATLKLMEEQVAAGVKRELLLEEFTTVVAAKVDLLDAGIAPGKALAVLGTAMAADPQLEKLTTITAAMIDLVDEGLGNEEALQRIQSAIKDDPTLDSLDDLLEGSEAKDD